MEQSSYRAPVLVDARIHGRPREGESCSGDAGVVRDTPKGTWVMLVDGLGHGPAAEVASSAAVEELETFEQGLSVEQGLQRIHERLRGTRGAAATLAWFDDQGVVLGGVGNVTVRSLASPSLPFVPDSGVLGGRIRKPRSTRIELEPGARMLLHTDGIVRTTPFEAIAGLDAEAACAILLEEHSHAHDDATLIHVTYLGPGADPPRSRA